MHRSILMLTLLAAMSVAASGEEITNWAGVGETAYVQYDEKGVQYGGLFFPFINNLNAYDGSGCDDFLSSLGNFDAFRFALKVGTNIIFVDGQRWPTSIWEKLSAKFSGGIDKNKPYSFRQGVLTPSPFDPSRATLRFGVVYRNLGPSSVTYDQLANPRLLSDLSFNKNLEVFGEITMGPMNTMRPDLFSNLPKKPSYAIKSTHDLTTANITGETFREIQNSDALIIEDKAVFFATLERDTMYTAYLVVVDRVSGTVVRAEKIPQQFVPFKTSLRKVGRNLVEVARGKTRNDLERYLSGASGAQPDVSVYTFSI